MNKQIFLFFCLQLSVSALVLALPQCTSDCESVDGSQPDTKFCSSSCSSSPQNIICSCTAQADGNISCSQQQNDQDCPETDLTSENFSEGDCTNLCAKTSNCKAYTWQDSTCKLLSDCTEGARSLDNVSSGRTCSTCPTAEYSSSHVAVHWNCTQGLNLYRKELPDQTVCWPLHRCYTETARVPSQIVCDGTNWRADNLNGKAIEPTEIDQDCECKLLKIPAKDDTTVFCQPEEEETPGQKYWLLGRDNLTSCDMVCDGDNFIPVKCTLPTEFSPDTPDDRDDSQTEVTTRWTVNYQGTDIELPPESDCLACSSSYCQSQDSRSNGQRKRAITLEDIKMMAAIKKLQNDEH